MNLKNINIYKLISRLVLIFVFVLSTVQTVMDMQIAFDFVVPFGFFVAAVAASIIPISALLIIMAVINGKTKNADLFVIPEIRYVIKTLLYVAVFSFLMLWSIGTTAVMGFYFVGNIPFINLSSFFFNRLIFSAIYSLIIIGFFYGLSDLKIKKPKDKQ